MGKIYEDAYFKTNVSGATANGVKVGIYFYSTAINENEALEEAAWVISKIKTYRITYPVVYDFEDFGAYRCSSVGGAQATSNANTFLNLVKNAGYEPMMYANKSDITTRMSRSSFNCKFWLAHYTTQTNYQGNYNMWQYTSRGSVNGINGNVDMDIAYFSYGDTAKPRHEHNFSELVKNSKKEPTCTEDGSQVMRCSCGDTEVQVIKKLGHKFGEWTIVKEATTSEEGKKTRKCSVCGFEETQAIEKIKVNSNTTTATNTSVSNTTGMNTPESTTNVISTPETNTNTVEEESGKGTTNTTTGEEPDNNDIAQNTITNDSSSETDEINQE